MLTRIDDWRTFLADGEAFFNSAVNGAAKRPAVFTPAVVYNLTAMAVEKYLMAFLFFHGEMPYNHTLGDIIAMVEKVAGPQPDLSAKVAWLASFQEICDLDSYLRREPDREEVDGILAAGRKVSGFVLSRLG